MESSKWLLVLTVWLLITFACAAVAGSIGKWTSPFPGNRPDQCENQNFDPGTMQGHVLEIQNTWSNAAYLFAGVLILFCTRTTLGYTLGVNLCVLAVLSGLYHASLQDNHTNTIDARMLDVAGIFIVLWAALAYGIQCTFVQDRLLAGLGETVSLIAELVVALALTVVGYEMANHRLEICLFGSTTTTFILVAAISVVVAWQMCRVGFNWGSVIDITKVFSSGGSGNENIVRRYFWIFLLAGGISLFFRFGDGADNGHEKYACWPHSPIQPHALWHVFSAVTLLFVYDFFAWSSKSMRWADWHVFDKPDPVRERNPYTYWATATVAGLFGIGFLVLTLVSPDTFPGSSDADCLTTGYITAAVFLVGGATLAVLKLTGVVATPDA